MKAKFSNRLFAFILDVIIIYLVSALITGFIPLSDKAKSLYIDLEETTGLITEKQISASEYLDRVNNITYEIGRETVIITIVDIVIYMLYFIVLPFYNNGQTVGKKILKIRIVGADDKPVSLNNYLIRSFILNSLAIKIILLVLIISISKSSYITISNILDYGQLSLLIASMLMIIIRKDSRGIHDLVANTKVMEE